MAAALGCRSTHAARRRLPFLRCASLLVALRSVRASSASAFDSGARPSVKAVLFDFDGSLVQSEEVHRLSFSAVLERELDHDTWYTKCVGKRPLKILQEWRHPDAPPAEELAERLKADATGRYDQVAATVGHDQLLKDIEAAGVRKAIVSSGTRVYINRVLDNLGIADRFELIVAGDDADVTAHKPDPQPYLLAARRMNLEPGQCVAVEDSPAGITSALRAGMRVIAVRNPANRDDPLLKDKSVIAIVNDFTGLDRAFLMACAPSKGADVAPSA